MVKMIPFVVILLKFVVFTTQQNYDVQKSNKDFYNLKRLLNEFGVQSKGQGRVLYIKPKDDVSENKYTHGDDENQNINADTLKVLFQNDKTETTSMESDKLCKTGRCGCGRGDLRCRDNGNDKDVIMVYNDGVEQLLDELKRETKKFDPNESKKTLRCDSVHGRCGRGRTRNDYINNNGIIRHDTLMNEFKNHGTKVKVNDNVDAIILDFNEILGNINRFCPDGKCNNDRNNELFKLKLDEAHKLGKDMKNFKQNVDSTIIDMTGEQIDDRVVKQVKNILMNKPEEEPTLSPEDLFTYYRMYKSLFIENIMDYVKNKDGRKRSIQNVTEKQKRLIDNVKNLSHNTGLALSEKEIKNQIVRILFGKHSLSRVVPHSENNNNIYIPEWFYERVAKSKNDSNLRVHKRLLPLTLQQRQRKAKKIIRLWRRDLGPKMENYGVPFEMQVQGLGQVIS